MVGTRVEAPSKVYGWETGEAINGSYCPVVRDGKRTWIVRTPNGHVGDLGNHDVVEHEDGTITVSPSILVSMPQDGKSVELWHGYLERGVWREV